ncbi:MAG: hypothetical protein AAGG75_01340 [Bacteroidota bacterium]
MKLLQPISRRFVLLLLFFGYLPTPTQAQLPGECVDVPMQCQDSILSACLQTRFAKAMQFEMQFYLMRPFPRNFYELIDSNIAMLNEAFKGKIEFLAKEEVVVLETAITLNDLYYDYLGDQQVFSELRKELRAGQINVVLTNTVEDTVKGTVLLGFTPVFSDWNEGFAKQSPLMDNMLISWEGMDKGTTLIHEMGHFMSLAHPWQLSYADRKRLQLESERSICTNFMNYNCFVNQFTPGQLLQMHWFARNYRSYLMN